MREYVPIFFDWMENTQDLTDEEKGRLIDAVIMYASGVEGWEERLQGAEKIAFRFMRGQVDRNNKISKARSEAGSGKKSFCKGGKRNMDEGTFKFPLYWGELFKNLSDREVGIIIKAIFSYIRPGPDYIIEQGKCVRRLSELSDEAIRIHDICLEDIRYQSRHPHSYRKPEEKMAIRNSGEYRAWRKAVYERDNYTCQNCGCIGGQLNAHHIKSFARYPSLRLDVDNGVTLCSACHKLAHNRGFRNA